MTIPCAIRRLNGLNETTIGQLAELLIDCVHGGASVGFMAPLAPEKARDFWRGLAPDVASGGRVVLVAEDSLGIAGTVQLVLNLPENQPHRANVSKMLVHRRARGQGIGSALLRTLEHEAYSAGRRLLVLDTITDTDADRLYRRMGWVHCGTIPDFALMPEGGLMSTSLFYRRLDEQKG